METSRKLKMMSRFSLVSALLITVFWTTWYLATGSVPVWKCVEITGYKTFALSRWWDVLVGPILSVALIQLLAGEENLKKDYSSFSAVVSVVIAFIARCHYPMTAIMIAALAGFCLSVFSAADNRISKNDVSLSVLFGMSVGSAVVFVDNGLMSLVLGLAIGLTAWAGTNIGIIVTDICHYLTCLYKSMPSRIRAQFNRICIEFYNWMLVK